MEDEVQGDQESGLHGEDGRADGDGVAPPHFLARIIPRASRSKASSAGHRYRAIAPFTKPSCLDVAR
jgi:hypothetical protein